MPARSFSSSPMTGLSSGEEAKIMQMEPTALMSVHGNSRNLPIGDAKDQQNEEVESVGEDPEALVCSGRGVAKEEQREEDDTQTRQDDNLLRAERHGPAHSGNECPSDVVTDLRVSRKFSYLYPQLKMKK